MKSSLPQYWRSILFIPAYINRFIESAHKRGADAIQLDLEDSVAPEIKPSARKNLPYAVDFLQQQGVDVLVRINRELDEAVLDLDAAIRSGVSAITIPKVMGPEHIRLLDEVMTTLERKRGILPGCVKLIAMIETVDALFQVNQIAHACPRLSGITLGSEDFSLDAGFQPVFSNLVYPCQQVIYAARSAGIQAFGFPGSIADYSDLEQFRLIIQEAKSMGFMSSFCIHPNQVSVINDVFSVTGAQLDEAKAIVTAFDLAEEQHIGAINLDGKMIDLPVVERARELLARANQQRVD